MARATRLTCVAAFLADMAASVAWSLAQHLAWLVYHIDFAVFLRSALPASPRAAMATLAKQCGAFRGAVEIFGLDICAAGSIDNVLAARYLFLHLDAANDFRRLLSLMARDIVGKVPARKQYVVHWHHAFATVFAAKLIAPMAARVVTTRARLRTEERLVHGLRVALRLASVAAPREAAVASQAAATFRAETGEVIGLTAADCSVGVARAAKLHSSSNAARSLELTADFVPHGNIGVCVDIAYKVHTVLGATQQDIDPVHGTEKPNFPLDVAADQRHDDNFGFLPLEVVNGSEAKALDQPFLPDG